LSLEKIKTKSVKSRGSFREVSQAVPEVLLAPMHLVAKVPPIVFYEVLGVVRSISPRQSCPHLHEAGLERVKYVSVLAVGRPESKFTNLNLHRKSLHQSINDFLDASQHHFVKQALYPTPESAISTCSPHSEHA
jgi:hypothetical protein